jgi:hypothetical protein
MYPIFWILSDGLDQINDNKSVIAFSVLDMASKIGFSIIFFRACSKSKNWLSAMFTFSRTKAAPHASSASAQQQTVTAPPPVASDSGVVVPAEATAAVAVAAAAAAHVDLQSPGPIRKEKRTGGRCVCVRVVMRVCVSCHRA